ncbi:Purine nucleoside phosphoramidase [Buchnera aphidicola (Thelaxes suberi)]|uniref:HIT domain-containing protein n=1 Tax=Buchnera aphidicola TaxID=9 RepID=UPI003464BCB9
MAKKTIFSKIINKEIKSKILYQSNNVTVLKDNNPQALVHLLVISNKIIPSLNNIKDDENKNILIEMFETVILMAKKTKIYKTGYRVVINCNKNGGQEIPHLHIHLLGGEQLGPILNKK